MSTGFAYPDNAAKAAEAAELARAKAAGEPAEFQTEKMSLSMGPSHPSTHGVLRLQMERSAIRSWVISIAATRRSPRT